MTALFCVLEVPVQARAQTHQSAGFLDVGSEREQILRVLQILGDVPDYPWAMRQLSPREEDKLALNGAKSAALLPREAKTRSFGGLKYELLPMEARVVYNSAFPYGYNDGPMWAGRGLTGSLSGGVAGRLGPLSIQLEPLVFEAQNQAFPLAPGTNPANPVNQSYPRQIDLPQRFGEEPYRRFDLGQSTVRLDAGPMFADLSTADQWWGPAIERPLILGDNAPGFLHASVGSSHPVNIGIGHIHGRIVWGRLEQSAYSPNQGPDSIRFMSGVVTSFTPRGVPGLELGAARFFHSPWPTGGLLHATFSRPLEGLLKHSLSSASNPTGQDADNQLASIFARWTLPASGFELYGEYGREDHNIDLRDLWQEPDHDAAYTVGVQRAWRQSEGTAIVVRGELLNSRLSALSQGRGQAAWYIHSTLLQGHTELGQLLGAPGGLGGGGGTLAVDCYAASGRWTVRWDRVANAELRGGDHLPQALSEDVLHSLGVERVLNRGRGSLSFGARGVWNLNRDFQADRFNLNLTVGAERTW